MERLAVVVGLAAEARLLRGRPCRVLIGCGTAEGAAAATQRAIADGATALLSFGLAGGLDPDLPPGALIIPRFIRSAGVSHEADPVMVRALGGATQQVLLGGREIVASAAAKRRLWQSSGAAAIDLESGSVAAIAVRRGVPFAVLRAICDPAGRDLPPAALIPLRAGGGIALGGILGSLLAHPSQVVSLLVLARDAAAARRSLLSRIRAAPLFIVPK